MTGNATGKLPVADWISLISLGFFIIMVGIIWIVTPNFSSEAIDFGKDFRLENVTGDILLPAPANNHPVLYRALMQLCIVVGVFQMVVLAFRFLYHDLSDRKIASVSAMAFLFSVAFFLNVLADGSIRWFGFVAGLVVSIGITVVVAGIARFFK